MLNWILGIGGVTLLIMVFEWEVRRIVKEWHKEDAIHGWGADIEGLTMEIEELNDRVKILENK